MATDGVAILREALEKVRLYGSPWWKDSWGTPSKVANEALLAAGYVVSNPGEDADPYLAEVKADHAGPTITAEAVHLCAADARALSREAAERVEAVLREPLSEALTNVLRDVYRRGVVDGWKQRT